MKKKKALMPSSENYGQMKLLHLIIKFLPSKTLVPDFGMLQMFMIIE